MKEAIKLYVEELKADGKQVPEPTTKAAPITVAV